MTALLRYLREPRTFSQVGLFLLPEGRLKDIDAAANKALARLKAEGLVSCTEDKYRLTEAGIEKLWGGEK